MHFDQLLLAACQVHVVYSDQLLGAAHFIHFISNHDNLFNHHHHQIKSPRKVFHP